MDHYLGKILTFLPRAFESVLAQFMPVHVISIFTCLWGDLSTAACETTECETADLDVFIFQSLMLVSFEELARMFFVGWNATPVISLPKF